MKKRRTVKRFSSNPTFFLRDALIQGETTGHQCDSKEVAAKMRTARKNVCRLFFKHEFLSSNKITSYFSRMSLHKKKNTDNFLQEEDLQAEEYEHVLSDLEKPCISDITIIASLLQLKVFRIFHVRNK